MFDAAAVRQHFDRFLLNACMNGYKTCCPLTQSLSISQQSVKLSGMTGDDHTLQNNYAALHEQARNPVCSILLNAPQLVFQLTFLVVNSCCPTHEQLDW